MIDSRRDYSKELANLCRKYNVKHLGLRGSSYDQENIGNEEPEIYLIVKFFPMEIKEHARCYFGLEKELEDMFDRPVCLCNLTRITHPDILRYLTRRTTDIYKA
ncbi:MAG: hypothetical protein ACYSTT_04570 [Planctomycetota bacterium]|jgi:predicted nucleotidyltransferase